MKRSYDSWRHRMVRFAFGSVIPIAAGCGLAAAQPQSHQLELNDVHFHLTNCIQEGTVSSPFGFYTGCLKGLSLALGAAAVF
jgi:hypothetical protein